MIGLQKIEKGTDNCVFDFLLENDRNGAWPEQQSQMIRILIKRHNDMIDYIRKLEEKLNE